MVPTTEQQERFIKSLHDLIISDVQVTMEVLGRKGVVAGWESSAEGEEAVRALRDAWSMDGKDDHVWIGDRSEGRSLGQFIEWVVCETEKGADPFDLAMQLIEFRRIAKIERLYYALIPEIWMDLHEADYFTFKDGTVLAPIELHPDRELAEHYGMLNNRPSPRDDCRLYLGFSALEDCHFGVQPERHDGSDFQRLQDIAMCINLSRPIDGSVSLLAMSNYYPAQFLQFGGRSWNMPYSRKPAMQNGIIEIFLNRADALHQHLQNCSDEVRDLIRIAARYLSHMGMADSLEDQLISLRVALEALFLYPSHTEGQRQTVAERASLLLAKDDNERATDKKLFLSVYDTLSRTAHSGRIHKSYDRDKADLAGEKLRQSLCTLIENGEAFDWEDLKTKSER